MESERLSESTQKLRKSLLIASLIGYAISKAGLAVTKVSFLGSELAITNFEVIPILVGIIVLYFWWTFIIFGLCDYSQSKRNRTLVVLDTISKGGTYSEEGIEAKITKLKDELQELNEKLATTGIYLQQEEMRTKERQQQIIEEIKKQEELLKYLRYHKSSIFARSWRWLWNFRTFFDLVLPILVGAVVLILLFGYTKIPEAAMPKPEKAVDIGIRLSLDDANNIASYSLIENTDSNEVAK